MDLGFKDRVAIVAAASAGLGKAVAEGLAAEGAGVAICSRSGKSVPGVEVAQAVDVTSESQVKQFVQSVFKMFGRIDVCVTNSGGPPSKPFADTSVEDWRSAIDLNFM